MGRYYESHKHKPQDWCDVFVEYVVNGMRVKPPAVYDKPICRHTPQINPNKWIVEHTGNGWDDWIDLTCPNCGFKMERIEHSVEHYRCCPHCAKLLGGEEPSVRML